METKSLGNYTLDILDITEFKDYYYENLNNFSTVASNSFLKALDIPPKFFKEQPASTQDILIENRDIFVREKKKFFNKVIVVLKAEERILNACRMDAAEAASNYEMLSTIDAVPDKFEHRSFTKDGYISYIIGGDIKRNTDNQVLAVDFPIMLNKKPVIHNTLYTLPDETFATPIEHLHYLSSEEIELGVDYNDIKEAINDKRNFISDEITADECTNILRDTEVVALALVEGKVIPKSYKDKIGSYIENNTQGVLSTKKLESLVLDFDETLTSYKQVTSLRSVSGTAICNLLESDSFKEVVESLEETVDLEVLSI